jgi:hypothetical protein
VAQIVREVHRRHPAGPDLPLDLVSTRETAGEQRLHVVGLAGWWPGSTDHEGPQLARLAVRWKDAGRVVRFQKLLHISLELAVTTNGSGDVRVPIVALEGAMEDFPNADPTLAVHDLATFTPHGVILGLVGIAESSHVIEYGWGAG